MHNLVPKGQSAQAHDPKPLCVLRWAPKASISSVSSVSQYLSVSNVCITVLIPHAYAPKRQKHPNTRPKASMCVQTGPKGLSSHIILSLYSSHIICITVSGREGYRPIILQTTFYTHVYKRIITSEISFPFYLTYLKPSQFYYHAFIQKTIIKPLIKLFLNKNK